MNIDEDLESADWPKRTWDQNTSVAIYDIGLMTLVELSRYTKLPSYKAAPPSVKKAVAKRRRTLRK